MLRRYALLFCGALAMPVCLAAGCGDDQSTEDDGPGTTSGSPTSASSSSGSSNSSGASTSGSGAQGGGGSSANGGNSQGGDGGTAQGGDSQGGDGGTSQGGAGQGGGGAGQGGSGGALAGTCPNPTVIAVPSTTDGDTTGAPNDHDSECTSANSGPELVYQFTPGFTGDLLIALTSVEDLGVSVRSGDCNDPLDEIDCVDDVVGGEEELLIVPVTSGTVYYLLVDGFTASDASTFSVELEELLPESSCEDLIDDDLDGLFDCEDPTDCQSLPVCTPGAGAHGSACTNNNNCVANANDPLCLAGYPSGYCSEWCSLVADDCGGDAECFDVGAPSGNGFCFESCVTSPDCTRPGYFCKDFGSTICYPNSCELSQTLVIGAAGNAGDTNDGWNSHENDGISCGLDNGNSLELVYSYTAPANGTLTLALTTTAADLGLYVRSPSCEDQGDELDCADALSVGTENLSLPVVSGETYWIFVDGFEGSAGTYNLVANFN
jgi:hypothetical protein